MAAEKHPHHIHIGLVIVLLILEMTVFKGYGILSTLAKLGFAFAQNYQAALEGGTANMAMLIPAVIGFVAALVIYYLLAGIIILVFRMFQKE